MCSRGVAIPPRDTLNHSGAWGCLCAHAEAVNVARKHFRVGSLEGFFQDKLQISLVFQVTIQLKKKCD